MVPYQTIDLDVDILWRSFQFIPGLDNKFVFADIERCYLIAIKDKKDSAQMFDRPMHIANGNLQCQRLEFVDGMIVCVKIILTDEGERYLEVSKIYISTNDCNHL